MKFLGKETKLVIFDLDGTLIASTSLWRDVDHAFFAKRNMTTPPNYGREIAHLGLAKAAEFTVKNYFPNEKEEDILKEWNDLALKEYKYNIPLKENAKEILELFYNNKVIIALATANSKELYEPCLERLGIKKYLSLVVDVNQFSNGKDSPEIYDYIVNHFKVNKKETVVFEDMLTPIITAYNAGYNVVAIYDEHSHINEKEAIEHSNVYIKSFKELL